MNGESRIVALEEEGLRLDKWLAHHCPGLSREAWKRRIGEGEVTVNGLTASPSRLLASGDSVHYPRLGLETRTDPEAEPIPLRIVYEDEWLAVIDKPSGLVVHPAHGHRSGTLVNALINRYGKNLSDLGGPERPGIVHRLDKDTSGLLLVALDNLTHRDLADLFRTAAIDRFYDAIVRGVPDAARGLIEAPIARGDVNRKKMEVKESGKEARTEFELIDSGGDYAHLRCRLLTGRTHQLRVHLAYIGCPVVGDRLYGGKRQAGDPAFLLLHASGLAFRHPVTERALVFTSPLPERFSPYVNQETGR